MTGKGLGLAREIRSKWRQGLPALGVFSAIPSPFVTELMGAAAVDYICFDEQHGLIHAGVLPDLIRTAMSCGCVPLVRVSSADTASVGRALDFGAQGVIVPMVNSREDAVHAVSACRYPPNGVRSYGPIRASIAMGTHDPAVLGNEVLCLVMVETTAGLTAVEDIAMTPGLDGIYIGPADLALGLGLTPDLDRTEQVHAEAIDRIRAATATARIAAGIQCSSGAAAAERVAAGFGMVTFGKDSALLATGIRSELAAAVQTVNNSRAGYA